MPQDSLNQLALRRLDEGDDLHRAATMRTGERVNFVDPLNEHRPSLSVELFTLALSGGGGDVAVSAGARPSPQYIAANRSINSSAGPPCS